MGRVYYSDADIAFNESYLGFSAYGHPDAPVLARFLFLVLASSLVPYLALMQSSQFGVERDSYLLADVKSIPFVPVESLKASQREEISSYAEAALADQLAQADLDAFVCRLYGLTTRDRETIHDTLEISTPFTKACIRAQRAPHAKEVLGFQHKLRSHLAPFFSRRERAPTVETLSMPEKEPWVFLRISAQRAAKNSEGLTFKALRTIVEEADRHGASLITYRDKQARTVVLGLLSQYRYWTPTRARLAAADLRRQHEDFLLGGDGS